MEIPSYYDLMQDWTVRVPVHLDGSGVCTFSMRAGNMKHFGLDKFPSPKDYGRIDPLTGRRIKPLQFCFGGVNQGSYRLAHNWTPGKQKPDMCRFRLGSSYKIETLQVITNWLRENYDGWFEIRNANGNNLNRRHFMSTVSLGGG